MVVGGKEGGKDARLEGQTGPTMRRLGDPDKRAKVTADWITKSRFYMTCFWDSFEAETNLP